MAGSKPILGEEPATATASRVPSLRGPGIPCVWCWIMLLGWDVQHPKVHWVLQITTQMVGYWDGDDGWWFVGFTEKKLLERKPQVGIRWESVEIFLRAAAAGSQSLTSRKLVCTASPSMIPVGGCQRICGMDTLRRRGCPGGRACFPYRAWKDSTVPRKKSREINEHGWISQFFCFCFSEGWGWPSKNRWRSSWLRFLCKGHSGEPWSQ